MVIHDCEQRSIEWFNARRGVFTASEFEEWCVDPVKVTLTVEEIKSVLTLSETAFKASMKRDELLALLPSLEPYKRLSTAARNGIIRNINSAREKDAWEIELDTQTESKLARNIPIQRGISLEPEARAWYEGKMGVSVVEKGFITHDSGGFGCSPDGLIYALGVPWMGVEIKCPMPETHIRWLLDGGLPDDHRLQVHGSMAVTGLKRWDFLSYCPGEAPLLVSVLRDDFTDKLEAGLIEVVKQKAIIKKQLRDLWQAAYGKAGE